MMCSLEKLGLALITTLMLQSCAGAKVDRRSSNKVAKNDAALGSLSSHIAEEQAKLSDVKDDKERLALLDRLKALEEKLIAKREATALSAANTEVMAKAMAGHTKVYPLVGQYQVLVVPVEFKDVKFVNPQFYQPGADGKVPAQDYLFGNHNDSLTNFYRHESLGQLDVEGEVAPVVTVDKDLLEYGEAVSGQSDKNARGLVVQALTKLHEIRTDAAWWDKFDRWDLNDYDGDKNYYEPDGFVDAVILIYAGKDQASCQRSFDAAGERPASADVPAGPRHDAAVECFNRIWPHRWSISISKDDPLYSEAGPVVEGYERPSMNGLKITGSLFALDYNMQSEFSDRSTFMHEFGHSLSLPDVYASSGDNSTGAWELMSQNAKLQAQEFSTYSKMSLGWVAPKIIKQGQNSSVYLGSYSFVPNEQREDFFSFAGPLYTNELVDEQDHRYDILSKTPTYGEAVYRAAAVLTKPSEELVRVVDFPESVGSSAAYSGRYDGDSRGMSLKVKVPAEGPAVLSFDTIYQIETETNFEGNDEAIKVVTDFDLGSVLIDGKVKEELRLVSGDNNFDSLNESNPDCQVARVLELRNKRIAATITEEEKTEFKTKTELCQKPTWVSKSYDLSEFRGKEIVVELRLVTDSGYTEFGIVADNFKIGDTKLLDFEDLKPGMPVQDWKVLANSGKDILTHNQFYLFEYRTPGEEYRDSEGKLLSYNMDNNIGNEGTQSFFTKSGANLTEKFRFVEMHYQPGVLVWYYNTKFGRTENNPSSQDGKGYLLVLNSKVQEIKLPGIFSDAELFDEKGAYNPAAEPLKSLIAAQQHAFICYGYTEYATYITGEAPVCDEPAFNDAMQKLTLNGKKLMYRREWFNDILPPLRSGYEGVGEPFRSAAGIRTGYSTFRPQEDGSFAPFKVYKVEGEQLVVDAELTAEAATLAPVSEFKDSENHLAENPRFSGDTVVVEKKGFNFKVTKPSARILDLYQDKDHAAANDNVNRRPRAKIYFDWE